MSQSVSSPTSTRTPSPLEQWIHRTIACKGFRVQYRVRGNTLHLLCRKTPCPDRQTMLLWMIPALQQTQFSQLQPAAESPIYQIWLYGCQMDGEKPQWTANLHCNQLDRQLAQLQTEQQQIQATQHRVSRGSAQTDGHSTGVTLTLEPDLATDHRSTDHDSTDSSTNHHSAPLMASDPSISSLALSNVALARRGDEMAIASYLSETLNEMGVAVRVSAKVIPYTPPATVQQAEVPLSLTTSRLWVACEASYSPDPALIGEPVTQKLRALGVEGFHDAVILFQVVGEAQPDWALRVDLTPATEMLREWARWGDLKAIQRLLNQDIAALHLQITTATLNASTLHLCCSSTLPHLSDPVIQNHRRAKADIALLLEGLAPQGIHAATLYGQLQGQDTPAWIEWLDLPATQHSAFAEPTLTLAQQGDWGAIAFLLHRLLNPDLDAFLQTGGTRIRLLPKQDLLHVMCEAASCPDRRQVVPVIVRFLRQITLREIAGVRVYGRRSGQKKPLWSYGSDFTARSRLVPEVTPEFAATEAYVADLLTQPDEPVLRPDLTTADIHQAWQTWQQRWTQRIQQVLLRSQLFDFAPEPTTTPALPGESAGSSHKVALIWGAAGVLLMVQLNGLLGLVGRQPAEAPSPQIAQATEVQSKEKSAPVSNPTAEPSVKLPQPQKPAADASVFNSQGFTETVPPSTDSVDAPPSSLPYTRRSQTAALLTAEILAEAAPLPSFNSQQLDEKLQLYYRFIEESGPPDVLVVGSSRALRGVDPLTLQKALDQIGYKNATVFNLGINGATAQVVDLLLRQVLAPDQLPRLIVWADGARAFNSGTEDVTYNGIVASEAYQQLRAGTLPIPHRSAGEPSAPAQATLNTSLTESYQAIDRWLSDQLGRLSGHQEHRDQLKQRVQQGLTAFLPQSSEPLAPAVQARSGDRISEILQTGKDLPDELGFLSLAVQFNPATYYQKYARVLGAYDSDYKDFQISGTQETALQSLLKFTEASKIPVVFVNLPLTEDYLDPVRLRYEQEFRDYMVQTSLNHPGFLFRDLSEQWTTRYSYFSDPSHLNRYGAYAVARQLAQDAKIPWLESKQPKSNSPEAGQTVSSRPAMD